MRMNSIIGYLVFGALSFTACDNDHNYKSNDPDANLKTPAVYFVQDEKQTYDLFYKPSKGWVGDPMPFYNNGKFHIFYLYDARDGANTFHPWYKTTTSDFVSYTDDGEMIACGAADSQEGALGTGSVFEHNGTFYAFYTGHNDKLDPKEKILLATSTDLKTWTKITSFELRASDGYDRNEFRDPVIIKNKATGKFNMLLSTRADYKGSWRAVIACYSSSDLINWTLEMPYYDDDTTFMLECPDVFEMGGYEYLIYSNIDDNDRRVHYRYRQVGTVNWTVPALSNLDGRAFYAGKTVSNGIDRYLLAWCPTRDKNQDSGAIGWGGSLVVHKLYQNQDGTLSVTYPHDINDKYSTESNLNIVGSVNKQAGNASYALSGSADKLDYVMFDRLEKGVTKITTTIKPSTAKNFGFEFGSGGNRREVSTIAFDIQNKELKLNTVQGLTNSVSTQYSVPLMEATEYNVTIIIENAICVVYVNHQIALTNRIYRMSQNAWSIFSNDGDVTFSDVKLYK